jgi:hypothetical protein
LSHLISPELAGARPASLVRSSGGRRNDLRPPLLLADTSNGKTPDRQLSEKIVRGLGKSRAPESWLARRTG